MADRINTNLGSSRLRERISKECHDHPWRSFGQLLSLSLSIIAICISMTSFYRGEQREGGWFDNSVPLAYIVAQSQSPSDIRAKFSTVIHWNNGGQRPLVLVKNDIELLDEAGQHISLLCCGQDDEGSLDVDLMPGNPLMSQAESASVPKFVRACMTIRRPNEQTTHKIQKTWRVEERQADGTYFPLVIDSRLLTSSPK